MDDEIKGYLSQVAISQVDVAAKNAAASAEDPISSLEMLKFYGEETVHWATDAIRAIKAKQESKK